MIETGEVTIVKEGDWINKMCYLAENCYYFDDISDVELDKSSEVTSDIDESYPPLFYLPYEIDTTIQDDGIVRHDTNKLVIPHHPAAVYYYLDEDYYVIDTSYNFNMVFYNHV